MSMPEKRIKEEKPVPMFTNADLGTGGNAGYTANQGNNPSPANSDTALTRAGNNIKQFFSDQIDRTSAIQAPIEQRRADMADPKKNLRTYAATGPLNTVVMDVGPYVRPGASNAPSSASVAPPSATISTSRPGEAKAATTTAPPPSSPGVSAVPDTRYFEQGNKEGRYSDNPNDPRAQNRGNDIRAAVDGAYRAVPGNVAIPAADTTGAREGYTFTTNDLVDLYGNQARSTLTDDENNALIAQRKAAQDATGSVWENGNLQLRAPGTTDVTGQTASGAVDITPKQTISLNGSGPAALLASALPMALQIGAAKHKAALAEQNRKQIMDKYGIDMKRLEMQYAIPQKQAETQKNLAETQKIQTEAGGTLGLKNREELQKMYADTPFFESVTRLGSDPAYLKMDDEQKAIARSNKLAEMYHGTGRPAQPTSASPRTVITPEQRSMIAQRVAGMNPAKAKQELIQSGLNPAEFGVN